MNKLNTIFASAYSATVSVAFAVFATIYSELSAPFKDWLTNFTGHHWVTKSWMTVILFAVFYAIFRFSFKAVTDSQTRQALWALFFVVIAGTAIIFGFYVYEFFGHA